jgi:hypothetical protein
MLTPIAYSQEGKQWIHLANTKIQSNYNHFDTALQELKGSKDILTGVKLLDGHRV